MSLPPLTSEALAPFATVLRAKEGRFTDLPEVTAHDGVPGRHGFVVLCPQPAPHGPIAIGALERHPHSTQTFLPLRVGRWIVLVAPTLPDGTPDAANARAVLAGPGDAVCIGRDVWHAGLTVLDQPAEVGMLMWKAEAGDDGILFELPTPIILEP